MIEIKLKYFKNSEFDQPGSPGSWINMDLNLLILIDKIRHRCGIPLKINSAYRDPEYNKSIKGVDGSTHCEGKALDISAKDSRSRYLILEAAIHFGIRRIGIANSFIHIDISEASNKPAKVAWLY